MYRHMIEFYDLAASPKTLKVEQGKTEARRTTIANFEVPSRKPPTTIEPPCSKKHIEHQDSAESVSTTTESVSTTTTTSSGKENFDPFAQKIVDETSRLSDKQREILRKTYTSMEKDGVRNGLKIFVRLFSEYPRYKLIWPQFRAIPDSSLMNAIELRRHASVYLKGLGKIIDSMRDEEELGKQLARIAQAHIKWNVQRNHVVHMIEPVLEVVKECNGYQIDEETRVAWTVLYQVIANLIEVFRNRALHE